jgi:hypothetical protein
LMAERLQKIGHVQAVNTLIEIACRNRRHVPSAVMSTLLDGVRPPVCSAIAVRPAKPRSTL